MSRITVIGFGKIGQAIAANILQHGIQVTAIDKDRSLLAVFEQDNYSTKEPGISEILIAAFHKGQLSITTDFAIAKGSEAIIISIPLVIDEEKKILSQPFLEAFEKLSPGLANKVPVIIETSMPVGFSRTSVVPVIEQKGKKHGVDFLLAHSPERIKSGTMMAQLKLIPKVIGGINEEALQQAIAIYQLFFDGKLLQPVESIEAAEMVKLAGMIYRDINIALSNQLARFADAKGINYADLIPLINTDREADLLYPGIGVGGHCTPVYPYFLIENFKEVGLDFSLAEQSRQINNQMAAYAVSLIRDSLQNKTALILGLGFRPNVKEDALSTAYLLHDELKRFGFRVKLHDVEFSHEEISNKGFDPATGIYDSGAEAVFLVTMHKEYQELDFKKLFANGCRHFVDGRNSVDRRKVTEANIRYYGIGR